MNILPQDFLDLYTWEREGRAKGSPYLPSVWSQGGRYREHFWIGFSHRAFQGGHPSRGIQYQIGFNIGEQVWGENVFIGLWIDRQGKDTDLCRRIKRIAKEKISNIFKSLRRLEGFKIGYYTDTDAEEFNSEEIKKKELATVLDKIDENYTVYFGKRKPKKEILKEKNLLSCTVSVFNNLRPISSIITPKRTAPSSEEPPPDRVPEKFTTPLTLAREDISFEASNNLVFPEKVEEELKRNIYAALKGGKHILFFGPPGTGKTELARRVCKNLKDQKKIDNYILTTATADWTTYNTIGGYMPQEKGENLEFNPGQFLRCFREKDGKLCNKWLIIDELNRADIDKAFGQLFTVLSGQSVELPFEHPSNGNLIKIVPLKRNEKREIEEHCYYIPVKWRILSTINTYDKASLYEMSYAFMRRFTFIEVRAPRRDEIEDLMDAYLEAWGLQNEISQETREDVEKIWKRINKPPKTGVPRRIGPAIIEDLLRYIKEGGSLVEGLIAYVLPQFEGIREGAKKVYQLLSFFDKEGNEKAKAKLKRAAIDLLQIPLKKREED